MIPEYVNRVMDAVLDELAQNNNSAAAASFHNAVPVPDSLTDSLTGKVSKSEAVCQYKELLQKGTSFKVYSRSMNVRCPFNLANYKGLNIR